MQAVLISLLLLSILRLKANAHPTLNLHQILDFNSQPANQHPLTLPQTPPTPSSTLKTSSSCSYDGFFDIDFAQDDRQASPWEPPPTPLPTHILQSFSLSSTSLSSTSDLDHENEQRGTITMLSTAQHQIPISFILIPTPCAPLTLFTDHLIAKLSYQLQSRYVDGLSFSSPLSSPQSHTPIRLETILEHIIYKRIFVPSLKIAISPPRTLTFVEGEGERVIEMVTGIGGDELGALIRLFERALQELDRTVKERGLGGMGTVMFEASVDGVGLKGEFEVREVVDGVAVRCRG